MYASHALHAPQAQTKKMKPRRRETPRYVRSVRCRQQAGWSSPARGLVGQEETVESSPLSGLVVMDVVEWVL